MDEALKAKFAIENPVVPLSAELPALYPVMIATDIATPRGVTNSKEALVAAKLKKWFTLHPKVQAAFIALALVAALNGQSVYDGTQTVREAVHGTVGAVLVAVVAYLKKSNGSAV